MLNKHLSITTRRGVDMNRIKELRIAKGESQEDIAKLLNCQKQTISNYELGLREPKLDNWFKLADHFSVSMDYLTGYLNPNETIENEIGRRICGIRLSLGMTQEQFAKEIGRITKSNTISKETVNNWERGRNKPNKARQIAIVKLGDKTIRSIKKSVNRGFDLMILDN